ncbi:MAK10-like protein [Tanacetum coccineum]|uniref:MAK10-like protein n=1 Tax=Tanacetum coccineum TaxID=301880 RepID=A0ABQ4XSW2_9ASTR
MHTTLLTLHKSDTQGADDCGYVLQYFPQLMTRVDSLEKDLKQTKLTMGSDIVMLVKKVKKLEGILKRRNVVLSDSKEERSLRIRGGLVKMSSSFLCIRLVTPSKLTVNASGEEQVEDIIPTTLEAAKPLSNVASQKPKSIDKGRSYKSQREGKAPMIIEEAPKKTKEQILQEEASLAEAIRLDTLEKEEEAKQVHLDSLLAQRLAEEEELNEQQKQRKLKFNLKLNITQMKIEILLEQRLKLMQSWTWKLSQLKNLSFEEVKEEFDKLVKQTSKRLKSDEAKDDKSTKKTGKRRKHIARKGLHSDKTDEDESEDSKDADPNLGQGKEGDFGAMLKDITRDDLTELYRIVMNRYGMNGPEDELEKVNKESISWRYYNTCKVHCLNLESSDIYMLIERKYPLTAETNGLASPRSKRLTTDDSVTSSEQLDESISSQQPHATFPQLDSGLVVPKFQPIDDLISCLNKAMAFMSIAFSSRCPSIDNQIRNSSNPRNQSSIQDGKVTIEQVQGRHGQNIAGMRSKEKILLVQAQESGQVLDESNSSGNKNRSSDIENDDIGPLYDSDTVSENNSDITFDIPNMDSDRGKEEHDDVNYEQQHAFFASLINNLKCDVKKCNKVNSEAQQANALLKNELERYKEKEKHFAKDNTIESEHCKKINLLNDEILNLKSQACEKDKILSKENEKYDEYTDQTLRMLLSKEDNVNTRKQGLGFEKQNDNVNPSVLNKGKELAPCLYNTDEIGKYELSDHKIISEEELKCEAEKNLKVKQRKSPLSYHGFVYAETQFEEPPKVPLKRRNVNLKKHLEQTQNLKEHFKQAQNLKEHVKQIELVNKKKLESHISNDFFQKSLYDSDPSNVESESGEKKIIFKNETSSFETKIKELEMTLAQQTKGFKDAKDDFSKKTDKFETYFKKLEKTRVVLERQLDHNIQYSKAKKEPFLKQIASLESKLATQDLISNQKEYSDLRTLYNALKAKLILLTGTKGNLQFLTFKHQKCSFHGLRSEDPKQHLKDFLKLVDSLDLDSENKERTRLRLFQFSVRDQASNWLEHLPAGSITTWEDLTTRFLAQFFLPGRTAKLRNDMLMFQQHHGESLSKAWTRFKDLLQKFHHHGIDHWLQIQFFMIMSPSILKEINDRMAEMFGLLKELTTSRAPDKVLIIEEAKSLITKNVNSISLARGEEDRNDNDDMETDGGINRIDTEMLVKESKKENEAEDGTKNEPIKKAKNKKTAESSSSQPVGYYLKHKINEKLIEGLVDNHIFNDSLSGARIGKVKGKTYNLLPMGHVYEAILRKKITRKEDIGGKFEIPCNIGGLKRMNVLVDQGSDVNVTPLSTYMKLTNERPTETDIRLFLASHSYIYPLGIAEDVLVDDLVMCTPWTL